MSPKPQRVGQGNSEIRVPSRIGHNIQVAGRVGNLIANGGGDKSLLQGQRGEDGLHCPRGPQQVTGHRLGGADHQLRRPRTKHRMDGRRLAGVIQGGGGAVGVDVVHRLRLYVSVSQGQGHAGGPARPAGGGGGDVMGVAVGPVARYLGVDPGPPGQGVVQPLQQQGARPLPHDKAGALCVEGDGGPPGVGALTQGLHGGKASYGQRSNCRFAAAAQHHLGVAVPDMAESVAHGVGSPGAGRHDAGAHPAKAIADGHVARCHVGDYHGDHEGGDRVVAPLLAPFVGLAHRLKAADAAGEDYPAAVRVFRFPV